MAHDLFSSLALFESLSSPALLVREPAGDYRPAACDEILQAAQRVLARRVKGADPLGSPAEVRNFLRARLGALPHEVFAVVHLDARHAVIDYVEMFRGTLTQTSVYPREVAKDALRLNSSALLLVHCHPSGNADAALRGQFCRSDDCVAILPYLFFIVLLSTFCDH